MSIIAVDGLSEEDFRRSIENRLRDGQPAVAIERLRKLLDPYAGPGRILPERFMTVQSKDLLLTGWQVLEPAIQRHDRPGRPVTALSIAFGWPGEDIPQPDDLGNLRPHIETGYFSDDAFPFSQSARADLLDGYSVHGCTWAADCIAVDNALSLEGIDDLCGALALLEASLLASEEPDEEEIRAGSLGACLLSALLFQAVSERIERDGLPRPLCVMAGSNGVYPYFDAPVAGFPESARVAAEAEDVHDLAVPGPRYSSLLMTGVPRGRKRAVLVLDESADEMANRIAKLRGLNQLGAGAPPPEEPPEANEQPFGDSLAAPSPLLAKKHPSDRGWDFRDMLSPREPEPPAPVTDDADWEDWPTARPPTAHDEPPPPRVLPGPGEWEDWSGSPFADEPVAVPDPEPVEDRDETEPADLFEPEAIAVVEPEWLETDLSEPEPPAMIEPQDHRETVDWPEEPPLAESPPGQEEFAPVEWTDPMPEPKVVVSFGARPAKPGFDLLDSPEPEARPLPSFDLAPLETDWSEPRPEPQLEPEPEPETAAEPARPDMPDWPFGLDWLEVHAPPEAPAVVAQPESPGLWSRLRFWIRR